MEEYEPECPTCKTNANVRLHATDGAYICTTCGRHVKRYVVSEGIEWRTFKSDSGSTRGGDPNRVGGKEKNGELSSLTVGPQTTGLRLPAMKITDKQTLRQRKLEAASRLINVLQENLELKRAHGEMVREIYRNVDQVRNPPEGKEPEAMQAHFRSLNTEALVAACFYVVAKLTGVPRKLKDVTRETTATEKQIRTAIKRVNRYKKRLLGNIKNLRKKDGSMSAKMLVRRYANKLSVPHKITELAETIADMTMKSGCLEGKKPATIAGAALLIALEEDPDVGINMEQMEQEFGIRLSTLTQRAKIMRQNGIDSQSARAEEKKILDNAK
ncbi:hypothetical protein AAMO2058_000665500 [Amorphochlora amoebiformis]